jgi:hypothetical protein
MPIRLDDQRRANYARLLRYVLIVIGVARALYYFFVQDIQPWTFWGLDARAYWRVDLAHPYLHSEAGQLSAYLYSPVFAQVMAPFSNLPFEVFFALLTLVNLALLVWLVRPWPWAVPMLILPIIYELCMGNIHFLLAAMCVVGAQAAAPWAFGVLTKVTPGVGSLWLLFRGRWRAFAGAVALTLAIAAISYLLSPTAWQDWIAFLQHESSGGDYVFLRFAIAVVIVLAGARTNRPWTIAVAVWLALPIIWINAWVILLGCIRLQAPRPVTVAAAPTAQAPAAA